MVVTEAVGNQSKSTGITVSIVFKGASVADEDGVGVGAGDAGLDVEGASVAAVDEIDVDTDDAGLVVEGASVTADDGIDVDTGDAVVEGVSVAAGDEFDVDTGIRVFDVVIEATVGVGTEKAECNKEIIAFFFLYV